MPTTVPSPRSKGQTARAAGTNRESFQPALTNLPPRLVLWLGRLVGCGRSHLHAPCVTPHGLHWPARRSLHPGPRLIPRPRPRPCRITVKSAYSLKTISKPSAPQAVEWLPKVKSIFNTPPAKVASRGTTSRKSPCPNSLLSYRGLPWESGYPLAPVCADRLTYRRERIGHARALADDQGACRLPPGSRGGTATTRW